MYFNKIANINQNYTNEQDHGSLVYILWQDETLCYVYSFTDNKKRYLNLEWLTILPFITPTTAYELISELTNDDPPILADFYKWLTAQTDIDEEERDYLLPDNMKIIDTDIDIVPVEHVLKPLHEFEVEPMQAKPKPKEQKKSSLASRLNINRLI